MDQASLMLLNLAFMFDRKSLLKVKKLMITPESLISFNSTLRKFNIHSRSTDVLKSQPLFLAGSSTVWEAFLNCLFDKRSNTAAA